MNVTEVNLLKRRRLLETHGARRQQHHHRAFYGIRLLTTKDGTPTNAVYGFLNILLKLLGDEAPDALCVCFDLPAPTFRHEQYDAYKAQRKPMPDELATQMPILKDVLDAMKRAAL
jgi:DNA polymerase-1